MEKAKYSHLVINSTVVFVVAAILETILHESGHFVAAIISHAKNPVLYHNYVDYTYDSVSLNRNIFTAAAGPLVSLLVGILFHYICVVQSKPGMLLLFNLNMAISGYIGFLGYLMVSPFFSYGDTGFVFRALNFPPWLIIVIAILGLAALMYLFIFKLGRYYTKFETPEMAGNDGRTPFYNALILYPIYFGIVCITLLNLPVPTFLSLLYPLTAPLSIRAVYRAAIKQSKPIAVSNQDIVTALNSINYMWLVLLAATVIINRIEVYGISWPH